MSTALELPPLTMGSLFSGIGGFDLAGEWMGWETRWQSEIDRMCVAALAHLFPRAKQLGDIVQIDWSTVERTDVITGGFPCQPHSVAGKRAGASDERNLWPEVVRCLRVLRPEFASLENVPGILGSDDGRMFATILGDLAALGYDAEWGVLGAGELGAPHQRDRLWLLAYPPRQALGHTDSEGRQLLEQHGRANTHGWRARVRQLANPGCLSERAHQPEPLSRRSGAPDAGAGSQAVGDAEGRGWGAGRGEPARRPDGGCETVEHTHGGRCEQRDAGLGLALEPGAGLVPVEHAERQRCEKLQPAAEPDGSRRARWASEPVCWDDATPLRGADGTVRLIPKQAAEEGTQSSVWIVADGVPGRVAQLRAIGNAIVPLCAYLGPYQRIDELRHTTRMVIG